jgi:hypothetical protein
MCVPVEHARRLRRRLPEDPRRVRPLTLAGPAHRWHRLRRSGRAATHCAGYWTDIRPSGSTSGFPPPAQSTDGERQHLTTVTGDHDDPHMLPVLPAVPAAITPAGRPCGCSGCDVQELDQATPGRSRCPTRPGPRRLGRSLQRWDEGGLLPLIGSPTSEPVRRGGPELPRKSAETRRCHHAQLQHRGQVVPGGPVLSQFSFEGVVDRASARRSSHSQPIRPGPSAGTWGRDILQGTGVE